MAVLAEVDFTPPHTVRLLSISGHKTRSVFERYNIVAEKDLNDAVAKMESRSVTNRLQTPEPPAPVETVETRKLLN